MMLNLNKTRALLWVGILLMIAAGSNWISAAKQAQGPTNLVAWDSGRYVQLNWDLDQDSHYNIYRSDKGPDQWTLIKTDFAGTSFVDYEAPRFALIYYRVSSVNVEASSGSVVSISTTTAVNSLLEQTLSSFDKNNIITDGQLTDASTMTAAQIQSFLSDQGSVLANYSFGGKTAAQRIYDDCQTHGINPQVVLVTLQKEKGLIKSATANPNLLAMGWNTGDSTTSDFANQIYYGTRQFKLYFNNLAGYGWSVGQPHSVSDGTVTAANIASAGLYIYTPWIGQGGGGQTNVGGNYLFWDLWYNTFGFEAAASSVPQTSTGFYWPTGNSNLAGTCGTWLGRDSNSGGCYFDGEYHIGMDILAPEGASVYPISDGVVTNKSTNGWGTGNVGIVIRHTLNDGSQFLALYGHVRTSVNVGDTVTGGIAFATIGPWPFGTHVHFGIHPGLTMPSSNWGSMPESLFPSTNGFVDPIDWIKTKSPSGGSSCTNGSTTLRNFVGGPPIHPPGTVIKTASNPTVYLIDADNKKRPITSAGVLAQLYNQSTDARSSTNFSNWVITVAQDELDLYEQGGNLSAAQPGNGKPFPDGKLIGFNNEVSIVTGGGKRRPFADGPRFLALGYSFCQVVNVTQTEYNSYPAGPPVDAMLMLVSSVNITPAAPYTAGQTINGSCGFRNVGYASMTLSNIGIGGRFNGSTIYDIGFDEKTLAAGEAYTFGPRARQLTNAGTYDFFAAYQENNGHWALSVPASSVTRSRQITASTPVVTRTLTVASQNPVSISVSPNDNSGQGSGTTQFTRTYNNGVVVTVTAPSTSGSNTFLKWQRDGIDVSSNLSTTVTMDANHTMTAVYSPPQTLRTLTVDSTSSGVFITASPADNNGQTGGTTQFALTYTNGATVSLTAPATFAGDNFQKWQRDSVDWSSNATANVSMDADHTMTAVYVPPQVTTRNLTVASSPVSGVSITVSPNDNSGQGNGATPFIRTYNDGVSVTVTAPGTANGNSFQKWQRDGVDLSTNASITITINSDQAVTAVYAGGTPTTTNYALAANGGSVTASSTLSPYVASNVIDGSRRALNNTLWLDNTYNSFGDWVEVNFNGSKTISEIDVITQQDDPNNPVEPTLTQTFSLYGITTFDVQYWNGSAWTTVPGGSVTGNNKVWRQFTFTPITTTKIRVLVNGGADNAFSRVVEIEAWSGTPPPIATNCALAVNGGSVTASSTLSPYVAGNVIDGSRRAINNTLWLDNTYNSFGDWVEVNFNGSKTISEIDVITQQDDPNNPVEPTLTQTFSLYGVTAFNVQYWNGSAWTTVPGGSVTGNNKVWRQFTFTPITTTKIRVLVNGGADNAFSRVVEIEAWSGTPPTTINYARATNGGSVTASSTLSPYIAGNVIDGSRRAINNTLWLDNTYNSFDDWVEVNFNGSKTISEIDVITQQDDPNNPVEPTLTQTFSLYGVTAFDVQYWNGSAWTTVPGGSVTGNNKVWRQFTFAQITTSRIRVLCHAAMDNGFSRLTEVEAWGSVGP